MENQIPMKRMAACATYFDDDGNLLIVKPHYRADWLLPGGIVETNESPYDGCCREVHEELGQPFPVRRLLCCEYQSANGDRSESLQFIFYGGVLSPREMGSIHLQASELTEYRLSQSKEWKMLLNPFLSERLEVALGNAEQQSFVYLENKKPISSYDTSRHTIHWV